MYTFVDKWYVFSRCSDTFDSKYAQWEEECSQPTTQYTECPANQGIVIMGITFLTNYHIHCVLYNYIVMFHLVTSNPVTSSLVTYK